MLSSIYIDNYKGFSNQFINIKRGNFFVGENSTGKSSILNLIDVILKVNNLDFEGTQWFNTLYDDLRSIKSKKSYVNIGFSDSVKETFFDDDQHGKDEDLKIKIIESTIYFYFRVGKSSDGFPMIKKGVLFNTRTATILGFLFDKGELRYLARRNVSSLTFNEFITKVKHYQFGKPSKSGPYYIKLPLQYFFMEAARKLSEKFYSFQPFGGNTDTKRFSPIRSLPKPIYNRTRENAYSSAGEHTPNTLASSAFDKKHITELVNQFGQKSGLFDKIGIKYLSKGSTSQFTIQVFRGDISTRIDQVGTGVSQVLPIVCEIVGNQTDTLFLFQQPELHLHPKAQSALGEFLFEIKEKEKNYSFIAETHSEYLIDSYRRKTSEKEKEDSIIQFFTEENGQKVIYTIEINNNGKYVGEGLRKYREFYLKESVRNIDL